MTREKVIEGLEYLITAYAFHGEDDECLGEAVELLKEQEIQLTMKYEEGFHDGYKQAMRESVPCYECQEFSCDDCKFKDNRTVKHDAAD